MAKLAVYSVAFLLLLALASSAPAAKPLENEEKATVDQDLETEKDDLKPAASHWGGWGGYGSYGGYPYYGSYYGYPGYGYGFGGYGGYGGFGYGGYGYGFPYGGYGHHGYYW